MNEEEEKLKAAMGALRDSDRKEAPPFDPMWKAASERARAPRKVPRSRALAITSGVAAAACVAIFVQTATRSEAPAARSNTSSPAAAAAPPAVSGPMSTATVAATSAATVAPLATATAVASIGARPAPLALDFLLRDEPGLGALTSFDSDPRF